jgi:lipoprotein-releasing system ATP-binding protein
LLEIQRLSKAYPTPQGPLDVLSDVSFELKRGEAAVITGPSGSGKSTLLYAIGALDPPTAGTITLDGVNPYSLAEKELSSFRNQKIGFVFQDHCLLPQCSAIENVLAPTLVAPRDNGFEERARSLLGQVGLEHRLNHRPSELSGGEKQRVAIARALVQEPVLLLCDEPTGNLDHDSAESVGSLLLDMHARFQTMLIVVTHSRELANRFSLKYEMKGRHLERS